MGRSDDGPAVEAGGWTEGGLWRVGCRGEGSVGGAVDREVEA